MFHSPKYDTVAAFSGTTTAAIDLSTDTLVGLITPASMAGTALTFQASNAADGTFVEMRNDENVALSLTISSTAAFYPLDPATFCGARYLKVVSSGTETGRSLTLATRSLE